MGKKNRKAGIFVTGSYLPEKILTNFDLEKMVDTTDKWIYEKIGIKERRLARDDQATSDLAAEAAQKAIESGHIDPLDIDLIIVATSTPDMFTPSTACIVQDIIKAKKATCFDINAACSGFNYALDIGTKYIQDDIYNTVLIICSETIGSHYTDWTDRDSCIYFGDGAGAAILKPTKPDKGILVSYLMSDGSGKKAIYDSGGTKRGITSETVAKKLHCVKVDGKKVWNFAIKAFPQAVKEALKKCQLNITEVDFLIAHQANMNLIKYCMKKLKLPMEKTHCNLEKYGNTGGPSVAIALDEAVRLGKIKRGDVVVLVGFGSGLTWGANIIRWCGNEDFAR